MTKTKNIGKIRPGNLMRIRRNTNKSAYNLWMRDLGETILILELSSSKHDEYSMVKLLARDKVEVIVLDCIESMYKVIS